MTTSKKAAPLVLDQLVEALDGRGVRWSVLRGGADLGNLERDVDLLVARDDLPAFTDVVVELGGVPLPGWLQGWHRFYWFRPSGWREPGLTLDVVTELIYGRGGQRPTELATGCLERRVRSGSLYELAPTDVFWTVMLHCLLDKGEIKERRARELETALPHLERPSEGEVLAAELCPPGWTPTRLVECVREGNWDALDALARTTRLGNGEVPKSAKSTTATGVSARIRSAKRRLPSRNSIAGNVVKTTYGAVWRVASSRSGQRGAGQVEGNTMSTTETGTPAPEEVGSGRRRTFRIALSGLDGSGKSRQTAALAAALREEHETDLVWVPFDIWPGSMLKLLPTAVRVKLGPRGRMLADAQLSEAELADRAAAAEAKAAQPQKQAGLPLRAFWWLIATLAAVSASTSLRRRMNRMTTEVVVVDRYRFDTIVKLQTWYPTVSPAWLARIVLTIAPAPDVECLLRVEGPEAYARKPEQYNPVQLTRQAERYDLLVASVPGAVAVDGQAAPEDVTLALTRLVDDAMHAR